MTRPQIALFCAAACLAIGGVVFAAHQANRANQPEVRATPGNESNRQVKPPHHDLHLAARAGAGEDLYRQLCAGCHGEDGKGVGRTSNYCAVPPSNLTILTQRNHGIFPEKEVMQILRYGTEQPPQTQNTTYMPVWKPLLATIRGESPELTEQRIRSLTAYLKGMQTNRGIQQ